jgi:hypothetical protein
MALEYSNSKRGPQSFLHLLPLAPRETLMQRNPARFRYNGKTFPDKVIKFKQSSRYSTTTYALEIQGDGP